MRERLLRLRRLLALLVLAASVSPRGLAAQPPTYPATHRDSVVDDYHGTKVGDPYRWLEQLDSPGTADWVKAQTRLTDDYLGSLRDREAIRHRLTALWNYSRTDVPWREAGRLFYVENTGLQGQPVLYVQNTVHEAPRPVLDPQQISPDGSIAGPRLRGIA